MVLFVNVVFFSLNADAAVVNSFIRFSLALYSCACVHVCMYVLDIFSRSSQFYVLWDLFVFFLSSATNVSESSNVFGRMLAKRTVKRGNSIRGCRKRSLRVFFKFCLLFRFNFTLFDLCESKFINCFSIYFLVAEREEALCSISSESSWHRTARNQR